MKSFQLLKPDKKLSLSLTPFKGFSPLPLYLEMYSKMMENLQKGTCEENYLEERQEAREALLKDSRE